MANEFDQLVQLIWAGVEHMMVLDEKGQCHNGPQLMHALLRNAAKLGVGMEVTEDQFAAQAKHHHHHMTEAHKAFLEHGAPESKKPIIHIVKG